MSLQMTTIYVCIGSACHLKGSYDIINRLQALIAKQELGERVEVRGAIPPASGYGHVF